jgi:hypothetical protein
LAEAATRRGAGGFPEPSDALRIRERDGIGFNRLGSKPAHFRASLTRIFIAPNAYEPRMPQSIVGCPFQKLDSRDDEGV